MDTRYDALVIGGGPAGSTTASLLAQAGWSVALLERKRFPRRKVCGEYLSATNFPLLAELGIDADFRDLAGPDVRRVGLFAGRTVTCAELPHPAQSGQEWGRALPRQQLDTLLLQRARQVGVDVRQPCSATALIQERDGFWCQLKDHASGICSGLGSRLIVAANGSWEPGPVPELTRRWPARGSDLLAFKAHLRDSDLPAGLMPLLAFPGGYGGLVHCGEGRVSFSCCIRRAVLQELRLRSARPAGEIVLEHVLDSCWGARRALGRAKVEDGWLSAGPIRPGMHLARDRGVFAVGNAAGEAHPAIAEGISMALQGGWLLARHLQAWQQDSGKPATLGSAAERYAAAWKRSFAARVRASSVVAHWAMQPGAVAAVLPLLRSFPSLLTWGARWSGKASRVIRARVQG